MNRIEFHPDGPHSDDYTTELASAYAETVRTLNYATGSHAYAGLTGPSTAYTVVGNLARGTAGLRQLLDQIRAFLVREADAGRLADDRAEDRTDDRLVYAEALRSLAVAEIDIDQARRTAGLLAEHLSALQSALSGLYTPDPDNETGER